MKLYLDTSTPTCILRLDDTEYTWGAGHDLAEGLHKFIHDKLKQQESDWHDISTLEFFPGPGSFTGLRIGASIINTLADQLGLKISTPDGTQHDIIIPNYGRPANITPPRK